MPQEHELALPRHFRAVSFGGGVGAAQVLLGLREHTDHLTGIITVTDSGRSTGVVRSVLNIPAPGDLRNAMVTLSEANPILRDLFQHRLVSSKLNEFNGVAFGNLFLAALAQMTGSFERAILEMNHLLKPAAHILPVTLANTHLCAELVDGTVRYEEVSVRALHKPAIKRVFLRDEGVEAYPPTLEAIRQADLITIGPGSLFTTVIAGLVVPGIKDAIAEARQRGACTVYVCNTTTQPGQTDGLTIYDHVAEVASYLGPGQLDVVLVNTGVPPAPVLERHRRDGLYLLALSAEELRRIDHLGVRVVAGNLIEAESEQRILWNKLDAVRHDPKLVAQELLQILLARRAAAGATQPAGAAPRVTPALRPSTP
ncbi:MAG TPA: gluconeogenesis factor YvcK family protein [Chloroflexota bacterium]|nr:gluconeogenesis factor YvcK family protein [Chloroflexota bacterium]